MKMVKGNLVTKIQKKAKKGDPISFKRKDIHCEGIVTQVRENSVLVEINDVLAKQLQYESNLTVVNHRHYVVASSAGAGNVSA
ncbi:DUF2187 family protein [Peribacillus sp. SCS-37]|uniref:DUF2187 family protein n=1 Tax=Paraperibacillus esterisolvens TaxID=3115296 RepID=UPI0039069D19